MLALGIVGLMTLRQFAPARNEDRVLRGYLQLRYLAESAPDIERELEAEVRAL